MTNFVSVSELAGDSVSEEQVERLCHRYYWAAGHCREADVLEAACGSGAGLGFLAKSAGSLKAGDFSGEILDRVRAHYGNRIDLRQFDAQELPFENDSFDVVILFDALYFIPEIGKFATECGRVLLKGGKILIAMPNPDLFDFNPAPFSTRYLNAPALNELFSGHGFSVECFGYLPTDIISIRQKILRPLKQFAVRYNLMPKTMVGKTLLKRIVFGRMRTMPTEITEAMFDHAPPTPIAGDKPDQNHKVLYCRATLC